MSHLDLVATVLGRSLGRNDYWALRTDALQIIKEARSVVEWRLGAPYPDRVLALALALADYQGVKAGNKKPASKQFDLWRDE